MKTCNLQRTLREKDKQKREDVCVCERGEEEYVLVKAGKAVGWGGRLHFKKKKKKHTGLTGHLFSILAVHYEDS